MAPRSRIPRSTSLLSHVVRDMFRFGPCDILIVVIIAILLIVVMIAIILIVVIITIRLIVVVIAILLIVAMIYIYIYTHTYY